jgi:hypothetical protein
MLPGQTVIDWSEAGEQLASDVRRSSTYAPGVPGRRHEVELTSRSSRDPLDKIENLEVSPVTKPG